MSIIIKYGAEQIVTASAGQTVTLNTAKYQLEHDLVIEVSADDPGSDTEVTINVATNAAGTDFNSYTMSAGSTWEDWVNSSAPDACSIVDGRIANEYISGCYLANSATNKFVYAPETIVSGTYVYLEESTDSEDVVFWVDGTEYTATKGTYWSEFARQNSDFSVDSKNIKYASTTLYSASNRVAVSPDDPIHSEEYYANRPVFTINGIAFTFNEDGRPLSAITGPVADRLEFGENTVTFDGDIVKNADHTANISPSASPSDGTAYTAGVAAATGNLSFSVNGINYSGLYGMPWYDWCRSTYNTTDSGITSRAFCYNNASDIIFGISDGPELNILVTAGSGSSISSSALLEDGATYDTRQ